MDALKAYDSDWDEVSDNEDCDCECPGNTSKPSQECEKQKHDFFGLGTDESSESQANTTISKDGQHRSPVTAISKTITVESETLDIELPGSSFWKDSDLTDLQILQQTSKHRGNYRHSVGKRSVEENIQGKQQNSNKLIKTSSHTSPHSVNNTVTDSDGTGNSSGTSKRKLYFMHPKIYTHLHTRYPCKLPTTTEWSHPAHAGATNRLKWSIPNYSHLLASCSMDSTVKVWNVWSQLDACVRVLRSHDRAVSDVQWSHDGKHLLTASMDKTTNITDIETGMSLCRLRSRSYVTCCKYHPGKPHLAVTGCNNEIQVWDTRTPNQPCKTFSYKDNFGQVRDLVFCCDGSQLFSCSDLVSRDSADRNLMAWDFETGVTLSNQIYQERFTLTRLKIHPTDGHLLAQSHGNYIAIFSSHLPYKINKHKRFQGHKVQGYSVGFDVSADGGTVYSGSSDGRLVCYNYQNGRVHKTLNTGLDVTLDVACHPVLPSTLAICGWDGAIQVWR